MPSDSGHYFCIVKNAWGTDTSQVLYLAVEKDTLPLDSIADAASFTVMNLRDTVHETWTSPAISADGKVTSPVICNDTALVRIVTAAKVHSVAINGKTVAADTSAKMYQNSRMYLPSIGGNVFTIEIVSEDRKNTKTYTLTIPSTLRPVIDPTVVRPDSGTFRALSPQCSTDGDSRVENVIVLRSERTMSSLTLSTITAPVAGNKLPNDSMVTVVKILGAAGGSAGLDDSLKPNTMYYYRFITRCGAPGLFTYGEGREDSLATNGKISISATVTVTANLVSDGTSDFDWEMYGVIGFCGQTLWSAPASAYATVNEGSATGLLGNAVVATGAPDTNTCTVSFSLADYDASSADDPVGSLAPTVIPYKDIATTKPAEGKYTFTSSKSYTFSDASGNGSVNYYFSCKYID